MCDAVLDAVKEQSHQQASQQADQQVSTCELTFVPPANPRHSAHTKELLPVPVLPQNTNCVVAKAEL